MNLPELRLSIDQIDDEILNLFLKRLDCVEKIGKIKKLNGLPIINQDRENEVLKRILSKSDKNKDLVETLFSTIIILSRKLQEK